MICQPCRDNDHLGCPEIKHIADEHLTDAEREGGRWCDCQHVPRYGYASSPIRSANEASSSS